MYHLDNVTDLAKTDMRKLALVEAAQCGEMIFTLLGDIWILGRVRKTMPQVDEKQLRTPVK
jgi:hypothetical protein